MDIRMPLLLRFIRNWALPLAMLAGVVLYFGCAALQLPADVRHVADIAVSIIQPTLIFCMLFITFCKVNIDELSLRTWHLFGLLFQSALFIGLSMISIYVDDTWRIIIEGAMICFICPTATAAVVVTGKLGGNAGSLTTYTVLINLTTAIVVSAVVPLIHPQAEMTFWTDFFLINAKVMPLLFFPIIMAIIVRRSWPFIPAFFYRHPDTAFYLWCVALAIAIAVTVRSIVHSDYPLFCEIGIAISSALACVMQFAFGRYIGARTDSVTSITAGQSLGQKNTVFAIWMGYTFLEPISSIAGGFYSVWHNIFNSWQLYRKGHK